MKVEYAALALLANFAAASPTRVLEKRETTWCENWGSVETGDFTIYHNNWGAASATSGKQCTTFDSITSEGSVSWSTSWTWAGGPTSVKSYANVALEKVNLQLSAISSIPSTWDWKYTGKDLIANVAYDLWLAPSADADNEYEIMIWLAALGGAGPLSYTGSPVDTTTIAGSEWKVYSGTNGEVEVLSFVATKDVNSFDGDLNDFFTYLTKNQDISTSMVATSLQAGTEPFTGSDAVLDTTAYTISVKSGSSDPVDTPEEKPSATADVSSVIKPSATAPATLETSVVPAPTSVAAPAAPSNTASEVVSAPAVSATSAVSVPANEPVSDAPPKTEAPAVPSQSSTPKPGKGKCGLKKRITPRA